MMDGSATEYLDAKERAMMLLGFSEQSRMPSNKQIRDCIESMSKASLGTEEVKRRLREMRQIAEQIMTVLDDCDPFLIGSTLSGQIRESSDIDLHAYCNESSTLKSRLETYGYTQVEEEIVENRKGHFVHLRFHEGIYPVEITIYPWSWRDIQPISSVTGKAMKRIDHDSLIRLLRST